METLKYTSTYTYPYIRSKRRNLIEHIKPPKAATIACSDYMLSAYTYP
jgi:carbonic anhydrase